MFVVLVVPIVGRFLAGRSAASKRVAFRWAAPLWLATSMLLVVEKAISGYEININLWLGVAAGAFGFATAPVGHRIRTRRSSGSGNR